MWIRICELLAVTLTGGSLWLVGSKKRIGFAIGMIGAIFFTIFAVAIQAWFMTALEVAFFFLNVRGWIKWGKEE